MCEIDAKRVSPSHPSHRSRELQGQEVITLYQTDKERKAEGRDNFYTAPELDAACKAYFVDCDSQEPPRQPTLPGLLLYLGVTAKEWRAWEAGEAGYKRHPAICQKALLEIRDRLEQRKDAAAIFLLKQRPYGGYTDRPEADGGGGIKINVSFGNPSQNKAKNKGNSAKQLFC